jgi:endonuclease-3
MKHMRLPEQQRAIAIIERLRLATKNMVLPAADLITNEYGKDPYLVLVSCILSLRTKDSVSWPASRRLFTYAKTPYTMVNLSQATIQQAIYPSGFYRQKAKTILDISADLISRFGGTVPSTKEELMSFKGVGLKTANLVLAEGFDIPALCVDVHVHRISNRLGFVATRTPEETEAALRELLPKEYWREFNKLLVMWGQNICLPQSPRCSSCSVAPLCNRVGVVLSR